MKKLLPVLALVWLVFPSSAGATTISPTCGSCGAHNTSFDLTYVEIDVANKIYQLQIVATYDPAGPPAGTDFTYLNSLAFKINAFATADYENGSPTLPLAPAEDTWTVLQNGVNDGGCGGSGDGFWCADSAGFGATHGVAGDKDTWVFLLDLNNTTLNLSGNVSGVFKAQFTDASGNKVGSLLSEDTTFSPGGQIDTRGLGAPEPTTFVLMGTGLLVAFRRKAAKILR